jgi:hypothetical protein
MASFRSLTADTQPLEDFEKAVPKAKVVHTAPQNPALHVHLFEWSQSSQDGIESSGLKSIEELESQNTSTVRVLYVRLITLNLRQTLTWQVRTTRHTATRNRRRPTRAVQKVRHTKCLRGREPPERIAIFRGAEGRRRDNVCMVSLPVQRRNGGERAHCARIRGRERCAAAARAASEPCEFRVA